MAKLFLRGGKLDAVLALGENGQPVYLSALQLRETLRLRRQQQVADCLAIPQSNDAGDRIDWYSPVAGKISSWAAASHVERSAALRQLRACQATLAELSAQAANASGSSHKLFGALLAKAMQFPDRNYVYLVDGQPVITFWGFVSLENKHRQDALDCLQPEDHELPSPPRPTAPPAATVVAAPKPVIPPLSLLDEPPEDAPVAVAPAPVTAVPRRRLNPLWALLPLALLIALGVQLSGVLTPAAEKHVVASAAPAAVPPVPAAPARIFVNTLPLTLATVLPPAVSAPWPDVEQATTPLPPPAKDDLVLPADEVKAGSVRFLNGNWQAASPQTSSPTGKLPVFRYQLSNGKGVARVVQADGIRCRNEVLAGLMPSGNLVITSRATSRCSDGSEYKVPDMVCAQGTSGAAVCTARFSDDTTLPMIMKRK